MNILPSPLLLLGVGGAGAAMVRGIIRAYGPDIRALAIDTDAQAGGSGDIPFLLLAMILCYVLGAGMKSLIITMTCTEWVIVAYFIRTQVMIIRDREYNMASKCLGTRTMTMITKNILPYLISVIMTYVARMIPNLISYEVFLSYMGLGLGTTNASLGQSISLYTSYMRGYPHLFWIPVGVLAIISISLYIVGQRLADAADPRTHM